ncbi:ABC transporter ATP-binding protein [Streptomyces sp. NPDC006175]|uniref:ABC transporter ATP-binding protein n=1 Tax=unclassified Streptomyces TaxID=2593676 RepID=UPI0033A33EA3
MTAQAPARPAAPVLRVDGVSRDFGGLRALTDVSFTVDEGEILGVIGPNGAGKTTLLNIMSGFLPPTSGDVIYQGRSILASPPDALARSGLVRSFQDSQSFPGLTVAETLTAAALSREKLRRAEQEAARVIDELGLGPRAALRPDQLSLPDRKLLEIARCIVMRPSVMLLDEVMAGLTMAEVETPITAIESLRRGGVTFILIEHVMPVVTRLADRLVVLDFGSFIASGDPGEVLRDERVKNSYLGGSGAES